jgi:hypothetical protein
MRSPAVVWASVLVSIALSSCASTVTRCAGSFPKDGRPGIYGCKDVSMSPTESETADTWREEIKGRVHAVSEECPFWTKKLEQTPADSPGLTRYVQYERESACRDHEANERRAAAKAAVDQDAAKPWMTLIDQEVASGTCDTGHREALEQLLLRLKTNLAMRRDEGGSIHMVSFVDHRILVASEEPQSFDFANWANSQVHVFAIAMMPIELDVHRGPEAVTRTSPWTKMIHYRTTLTGAENNAGTTLRIVHPKLGSPPPLWGRETTFGRDTIALDSRAILARAGEPVTIAVKGRGCTLLAAFRDLN